MEILKISYPWSSLVVGDEDCIRPSTKLLCLCKTFSTVCSTFMALFHTCLTVGPIPIQLLISFYLRAPCPFRHKLAHCKFNSGLYLMNLTNDMSYRSAIVPWIILRLPSCGPGFKSIHASSIYYQILLHLSLS